MNPPLSERQVMWVKGVDDKYHREDSWDRECCKVSKYLRDPGTKLYELEVYHKKEICPDCLEYTMKEQGR